MFPDEADDTLVGKLGLFKGSRHPGVALFHVLFKSLALAVYLFAGLFTSNFVLVCVVCILLLAFDFWTVKNVSGRLLVGLRWWNYVKEDGATEWVFEAAEDKSDIRPPDERLFWWGLYVPAAAWAFLLVTAVISLKLQWLIVVGAALALSGANVVGYTKCSKEAQARLEGLSSGGAASMLGGMMSSGLASNMLGGLMGRAAAPAEDVRDAVLGCQRLSAAGLRCGDKALAAAAVTPARPQLAPGAAALAAVAADARELRRGARAVADALRVIADALRPKAANRTAHAFCGPAAACALASDAMDDDWGLWQPASDDVSGDPWLFGGVGAGPSDAQKARSKSGLASPAKSKRPGTGASAASKRDDDAEETLSRAACRAWLHVAEHDFMKWRDRAVDYARRAGAAHAADDVDTVFLAAVLRQDLAAVSEGGDDALRAGAAARWDRLAAAVALERSDVVLKSGSSYEAEDGDAPGLLLGDGEDALGRVGLLGAGRRRGALAAAAADALNRSFFVIAAKAVVLLRCKLVVDADMKTVDAVLCRAAEQAIETIFALSEAPELLIPDMPFLEPNAKPFAYCEAVAPGGPAEAAGMLDHDGPNNQQHRLSQSNAGPAFRRFPLFAEGDSAPESPATDDPDEAEGGAASDDAGRGRDGDGTGRQARQGRAG